MGEARQDMDRESVGDVAGVAAVAAALEHGRHLSDGVGGEGQR